MLSLREYVTVLLGNSFCNTTNVLCLSIKHLITLVLYCSTKGDYLLLDLLSNLMRKLQRPWKFQHHLKLFDMNFLQEDIPKLSASWLGTISIQSSQLLHHTPLPLLQNHFPRTPYRTIHAHPSLPKSGCQVEIKNIAYFIIQKYLPNYTNCETMLALFVRLLSFEKVVYLFCPI